MKISIAIAQENAPDSAFVVWRGFEQSTAKAEKYGYDGIELALRSADDIGFEKLQNILSTNNIQISCISTGLVFSDLGLYFTHPDDKKRKEVIDLFKGLISIAKDNGNLINIGRVRGFYDERDKEEVEDCFIDTTTQICELAEPLGVDFLVEPVNRYETNFINSVEEGAGIIEKIKCKNLYLMPDVFHMNIEDTKIGSTLYKYNNLIKYIHLADSNRMSPGCGHIDFVDIFVNLKKAKYDGWVSVEILPRPNPDTAAKKAIEFIAPIIKEYNNTNNHRELLNRLNI